MIIFIESEKKNPQSPLSLCSDVGPLCLSSSLFVSVHEDGLRGEKVRGRSGCAGKAASWTFRVLLNNYSEVCPPVSEIMFN